MLPITLDAPLDVLNPVGVKLHTLSKGFYVALLTGDPEIGTCSIYRANANFDVCHPLPVLPRAQIGGVNGELVITA